MIITICKTNHKSNNSKSSKLCILCGETVGQLRDEIPSFDILVLYNGEVVVKLGGYVEEICRSYTSLATRMS